AEWNWPKIYVDYVSWIREGKPWPNLLRGGLKEGFVKISPYGPAVGEDARKRADTALAEFMTGEMVIYKGELKDNTGKVVVAAGKEIPQTDYGLERMDYLVEGVIGSAR
ncbi:MAG: BMP family ABC transporter substrate-binding protein, partial [Gammaproteobacteria bacterium]